MSSGTSANVRRYCRVTQLRIWTGASCGIALFTRSFNRVPGLDAFGDDEIDSTNCVQTRALPPPLPPQESQATDHPHHVHVLHRLNPAQLRRAGPRPHVAGALHELRLPELTLYTRTRSLPFSSSFFSRSRPHHSTFTDPSKCHCVPTTAMAKWGEGDARWKVEDLGEAGRNVNGWHWTEFNAVPWCNDRLKQLLANIVLADADGINVKADEDVSVSGEATINQRKGKTIPAYELAVTLKWKGTDAQGEKISGEVKLPYISEENHDEDPEVQVVLTSGDNEKVRGVVFAAAKPVIFKAIATFVKELRAGGPLIGAQGDGKEHVGAQGAPVVNQHATQQEIAPEPQKTKPKGRSIEIVEKFYASSKDIYDCFTDPGRIKAYTGSGAEADPQVGGLFSFFAGSIEGAYRKLEPYHLIEMDWRFSSWPEGANSRVVIALEEQEKGSVTLTLRQSNIPETDRFGNHDVVGMTQAGWKQQVLLRIRQVFGYGA